MKFDLGRVVMTRGALDTLNAVDALSCLMKHANGDWGDLDDRDKQRNKLAVEQQLSVFSAYRDRNGTKFWIITEADRSSTRILLPEDY